MGNNHKNIEILLIEDEKIVIKPLQKKLEDEGFEVILANDGEEGLKLAFEKHPNLILLDLVLPKLDGMSFLDKLRADSWGRKVPVIILTNLSSAENILASREKGVNDYLIKTDWKLSEVVLKIKYELGIL